MKAMKAMKAMALSCALIVLMSACQEGHQPGISMATRSAAGISDNDCDAIKADLVAKTQWFLSRPQSKNGYMQFDTAKLSAMDELYLAVRQVYTLDSLTFVNIVDEKDVMQELVCDNNYRACFLCCDKQVLCYALYGWQEQNGWQCVGSLHPRHDDQRTVNAFLDNLIETHDELFVYMRPVFLDKDFHSGSGEKWAKRFMEKIVYKNSENQFVYFAFNARLTDNTGKVIVEERVLESERLSRLICRGAELLRNPVIIKFE